MINAIQRKQLIKLISYTGNKRIPVGRSVMEILDNLGISTVKVRDKDTVLLTTMQKLSLKKYIKDVHGEDLEKNTVEDALKRFDLAKEINTLKSSDKEKAGKLAGLLKELGDVLGLLAMDPEEFLKGAVDKSDVDVDLIEAIIKERNDARKEKNWAVADAARKKLADMGVVIEDGPNGTTWRKN